MSYVYLLECTDGSTYVGATVNLDRRLRQHNKEIKGRCLRDYYKSEPRKNMATGLSCKWVSYMANGTSI